MATSESQSLHEWRITLSGQDYLISTSPNKISHAFINDAFATSEMSWAKPLSPETLDLMLRSSYTLGVYATSPSMPAPASPSDPSSPRTPSPTLDDSTTEAMVGMARFVTDFTTVAYLTDVFVDPAHRKRGVSSWLIKCCDEFVDGMPYLRRMLLMAEEDKESWYRKTIQVKEVREEGRGLVCLTRRKR